MLILRLWIGSWAFLSNITVADSTNALTAEWEQILTARLQNLVKSFTRGGEAVAAAY